VTAVDTHTSIDPLSPVRLALVAHARAVSDRWLAEADADAAAMLVRADREAAAVREEARAQGEVDAEAVLVVEGTRARRQARGAVLRAQREAYDELRRRVLAEVSALREHASYPQQRERLAERARRALGADAVVSEHPGGGVVAESGARRVTFSLEALADQALDRLGPDVEGLWSP
jgi:vacuolar-type H+-ATPase subunit E/Vma4